MVAAANFLVVYKYVNKAAGSSRENKHRTYVDFQVQKHKLNGACKL